MAGRQRWGCDLSLDPHNSLFEIRIQCERTIDAARDALRYPLTAGYGREDSPSARKTLTDASRAARELMRHLDGTYEFDGRGNAKPKEGACLG